MKKNAQSVCRVFFICLNLLVPVLFATVPIWMQGKGVSDCKPTWSDEYWWWQQAKAVAEHGAPLGYFGYNGGNAAVGTFAAWGMMAVMPYGFFAKCFGWTYHSYIYANVFYQVLGILAFILLVKPGNRALLLLLLVNAGQVVRNDYLIAAMQESVRCSVGLVAAGLLVWLYRHRGERGKKINLAWVFAGLFLFATGQIYLIWTIFFLPFFWMLNMGRSKWVRAGLTAGETAGAVWLSRKLLALTCTPYLPGYPFWVRLRGNLQTYIQIFTSTDHELFFKVYHLGALALVVAILVWIVAKNKDLPREEKVLALWYCALPAVFLAGHIAMYSTYLWTFTRGMAMGLFVFSFCACTLKTAFPRAAVGIWCLLCLLAFMAGPDTLKFEKEVARYKPEGFERHVEKTRLAMAEMEEHSKKPGAPKNRWECTAGTYYISSPITFAMPGGYADNVIMNNKIYDKMGWIMIGKLRDPKKASKLKNAYLELDYTVSSESDELIVLKKDGII